MIKERQRGGWPPPFSLFFLNGDGEMATERERDGHLHSYCSSLRGWRDGHLHSACSSLGDVEMTTPILLIRFQGGRRWPPPS